MNATRASGRAVFTVLGLWLAAAAIVGASGLFYGVPPAVVAGTNVTLVTLSLLALYFVQPLREWVRTVPVRVLVLYHTVRFVGIAFLVLHSQGVIPGAFAVPAGWGDIAVAVLALVAAFAAAPITSRGRWWAVALWNVLGLLDILFVLRTGIGLGLADVTQMLWITAFPLSLLPTFIVPLVIVTHILIFAHLWHNRHHVATPEAQLAARRSA